MEVLEKAQSRKQLFKEKPLKFDGYKCEYGVMNSGPNNVFMWFGGWVIPILEVRPLERKLSRNLYFTITRSIKELMGDVLDMKFEPVRCIDFADKDNDRLYDIVSYLNIDCNVVFKEPINWDDLEFHQNMSLVMMSVIDMLKETREMDFRPTKK